jgi:uncharacterized protein YjbI with pentapeptide repeats
MNEDKNDQNDHPKEEQQPSDEHPARYREISKKELKQILEEHAKWLESNGKEGEKANLEKINLENFNLIKVNLQKADLSGANLVNANLQNAKLYDANMQKAFLFDANLHKAKLSRANLQMTFISRANMQEAILAGSNLKNAHLEDTNLQKALLESANLQEAYLISANLQNANLIGANLQKADLAYAKLQQAKLREANLKEAYLINANLQNANLFRAGMQSIVLDRVKGLSEAKDLRYADFQGATGLLGNEFAQADVTGTKLPDDIEEFKALETVEKTSQNARKIFFAMLLGCVYSWLTIATTTDVKLLTNTASSPLPIIGTEIPIAWFFIAAPLVLMCLYFYFHLYLLKQWEGLSSLPAIFPDGKRLDERAYPWLLNGLVRRHFKRLKADRPFIAHIQEWITIFLAWWVVPITMMAFWLRYIPRHDWYGTFFHIGLIVLSIAFAIIFYRMSTLALQGKGWIAFRIAKFWSDSRFYYGVIVVLFGVIFSLVSYGAIEGVRTQETWKPKLYKLNNLEEIVPWIFKKTGYDVFVDFREQDVSEKPENYWEISGVERLESVQGAKLRRANLGNADMYGAFMVKADLREANLFNTELSLVNLQKANLSNANLKRAFLYKANLQGANLLKADLRFATLTDANLQRSYLSEANLESAFLSGSGAQLQQAELDYAILKDADLSYAELKKANLKYANLSKSKLANSNLQEANLSKANLHLANFDGANLIGADFQYSYLLGAKNLTIDQLSKVKTLYQTQLAPELMEQVKKCCPHLLEKPKEETEQTD